jgi:hypothetical protein
MKFATFDRGCVKTLKAVVGTQQENRSCGLGESSMRELRSIRINLAPRQRAEWFSHSLDPKPTSRVAAFPGYDLMPAPNPSTVRERLKCELLAHVPSSSLAGLDTFHVVALRQ